MSITNEKLQTIKDNVSKVYRSGQMDVIKNANSLKGFESSKAMSLDDVSPVEHEMNVKVRGKNILPLADSGIYYKGSITGGRPFIYNSTYRISDFSNIDVSSYRGVYAVIKLIEGETYTLTINNLVNNCATKQLNLAVGFRSSESTVFGTSEKDNSVSSGYNQSSLTFTVPNNYPYCLVGFYNYPTVSGDTVSFNAMQLELGTTATDYEPYNTDIQNVYSKNLIPFPYQDLKLGTSTYNGVDFTVYEDGSILINGTATSNTTRYLYQNITNLLGLKSGITISCSKNASDDTQQGNIYFVCNYYDSTGTMQQGAYASTTSSSKKTITDDWKGLGIYLHIPSGKTLNNLLIKPQLEIGSTATYYEKYHEPYPLVVSRYGKNLFNQYADTQMVSSYRGIVITDLFKNIRKNSVLSVSLKEGSTFQHGIYFGLISSLKSGSGASAIWFQLSDSTDFRLTKSKLSEMDYDGSRTYLIGIYPSNISDWNRIIDNYNIQIELGTTATDYEPYVTPTEYTPNADGVINGIKNLYPNTTLISNGDRVYIDCSYYKDIDKAYNKLSAEIALSGGE